MHDLDGYKKKRNKIVQGMSHYLYMIIIKYKKLSGINVFLNSHKKCITQQGMIVYTHHSLKLFK